MEPEELVSVILVGDVSTVILTVVSAELVVDCCVDFSEDEEITDEDRVVVPTNSVVVRGTLVVVVPTDGELLD